MKKLICHTAGFGLTVGKTYIVTREDSMHYEIIGDDGIVGAFTKEPDDEGYSVHDWLTIEDEDAVYRWKVVEVLPNGTGGTLREERFYDAYELALNHVLQAAALYNQRYAVKPLKCTMRGDLMFSVRGKGEDEFEGSITLERTAE